MRQQERVNLQVSILVLVSKHSKAPVNLLDPLPRPQAVKPAGQSKTGLKDRLRVPIPPVGQASVGRIQPPLHRWVVIPLQTTRYQLWARYQ